MRGATVIAALAVLAVLPLGPLGCRGSSATQREAPAWLVCGEGVAAPLPAGGGGPGRDAGVSGAEPPAGSWREPLEQRATALHPRIPLSCQWRMAPPVCDGDCPPGEGCCITGIRPRGICRPLAACNDQCLLDCATLWCLGRDAEAVLRCESQCRWESPDLVCVAAA